MSSTSQQLSALHEQHFQRKTNSTSPVSSSTISLHSKVSTGGSHLVYTSHGARVHQFAGLIAKLAASPDLWHGRCWTSFADMRRKSRQSRAAENGLAAVDGMPTNGETPHMLPRRRGRPPLTPRTCLGRWIQDRNLTVTDFAVTLRDLAPAVGLDPDAAPAAKTLLDAVNGRHWPHLRTVLLVRHATAGAIDVQQWVSDLHQHPLVENGHSRKRSPRA